MADTKAFLTPVTLDFAEKTARRTYRKKILPIGQINYKGRRIDFNREYLSDLVESFSSEAYDQVPFVLATQGNEHNELPERFRGELTSLELADDGLYGTIATNKDGAKILDENPKLGVSARIVEALEKSDGRVFKRAIRHVLGTMDPRVTGLGPWQPVDLSDETDDHIEVVDLSAATYEKGSKNMKNKKIDLSSLSDEQFQAILDLAQSAAEQGETEDEFTEDGKRIIGYDDEGNPVTEDEQTDEEDGEEVVDGEGKVVRKDSPTGTPTTDKVRSRKTTTEETFSDGTNLSNAVAADAREQVTQMRIDLAAERWQNERSALAADGVPPFLLDLAEPLLASPDTATVDLSNTDEPLDATATVRKILNGVKGMVDLSGEIGHAVDLAPEEGDYDDRVLSMWDNQFGAR